MIRSGDQVHESFVMQVKMYSCVDNSIAVRVWIYRPSAKWISMPLTRSSDTNSSYDLSQRVSSIFYSLSSWGLFIVRSGRNYITGRLRIPSCSVISDSNKRVVLSRSSPLGGNERTINPFFIKLLNWDCFQTCLWLLQRFVLKGRGRWENHHKAANNNTATRLLRQDSWRTETYTLAVFVFNSLLLSNTMICDIAFNLSRN